MPQWLWNAVGLFLGFLLVMKIAIFVDRHFDLLLQSLGVD